MDGHYKLKVLEGFKGTHFRGVGWRRIKIAFCGGGGMDIFWNTNHSQVNFWEMSDS